MSLKPTLFPFGKSMRYVFAILISIGCMSLQANAQCTGPSGTITVGPTGTYSTLTAALAATSTGISGSIIFELQSTYTSSGETFPITFPANACITAAQTITIRPQSGASGLSIASGSTTATIDLNGASYITIDGRPGGAGTTSQLTIANTATTGVALRFINDAISNTIKYCAITGVNTSTTSGVVLFSTTTGTNGNDNNTIDNCDIKDGATTPNYTIYSAGTTAAAAQNNSNNIISNDRIYNYFAATNPSAGIRLAAGNTDWTISNNKFFQTSTITQTSNNQHSAIWINNTSGNNFLISGNTIGYASATGTGTYTFAGVSGSTLIPIFLSVGTTTATSVQGNTITAIAQSGASNGINSSAPFRGIFVSAGLTNVGTVTGNTIGSMTATGSITYTSTSSTTASDIIGIFNFGSSAWTVANNNVGGFTVANSGTGATNLYGISINTGSSVSSTFQNNTVGGNIANSMQSTSTATGTQVAGIFLTNSNATVTGNTVRNLTGAGGTGGLTSASVIGINFSSSLVNNTVSQNTIFNLSNTNTTAATVVTGIQYTASTGTNIVERNLIYGLTSATTSATAEVNGIRVAGGTTTYRNNMIAIGAGIGNAVIVTGINEAAGTDNFWHNSVYVGGTATAGSANSFAFNSAVTSGSRSFRDNIFVNARSNSGATGKNYAIQVGGTTANPSGLTINNNVYYITGTGTVFGRFNALDVADLAAWRAAVGQDASSAQSDPQYNNPAAATPDLHLHASNPTTAEGNGADLGVVNDFDGQTRAGLTPVDIGADAGNYVTLDIFAPTISYALLTNSSCTTTRTLSSVVITDYSGINVAAGTKPRVYYKKSGDANTYAGNTSADNGWKYAEAGNTSSPFSFTLDYSLLQSAVAATDVIQYFVVAQDLAATPNAAVNSGIFSSQPSGVALTAAAFPLTGTINSFTISGTTGISGNVTVGAAGTYTSLTGTTGLFSAINAGGLSGNVTATIIDASVTETGAVSLNNTANTGCTPGALTLVIKPAAAVTATLTGSVASGAMIKLNGVSNVTIDGSNSGGTSRNLVIVNTATTAPTAIALSSPGAGLGVKNIVIKNTAIATGIGSSIGYGISVGGSTPGASGADNDNVTIQNDSITVAAIGIFAAGTSPASTGGDDSLTITGNIIDYNGSLEGIGIQVGNALNSVVSQNAVSEQTSSSAAPTAISLETGFVSSSVTRNNITKSVTSNTGGWGGRGITVGTGTAASNLIISNNFVSGVNGTNWSAFGNSSSMGIAIGTVGSSATLSTITGGVALYNNTVSMTGSMGITSTSIITTALYIGSGASGLDIRNNIISNTQTATSTSQKNYAIYSAAASSSFTTINNNDYNVSNSFNAASAIVGFLSADRITLANWQTATGQDAQSNAVSPVFVSATNLHLDNAFGANWCLNGTGATIPAVTTDIDLQARSTPPDMGADEFTPTDNSAATPATQAICSGSAFTTIALSGVAASFTWTRDNAIAVTGIASGGTGNINGVALTNTTTAPVTVTFTVTPLNAAGCALGSTITATVVVNPAPNAVATSAAQTICSGSAISTIVNSSSVAGTTYSWTRDNTASVTGIAASGTGNISGTLTNTTTLPVAVTFTITPLYTNAGTTCTGTPTTSIVTVTPANTLTLTSGAGSIVQSICVNTAITNITYATTGATGATFSGLPAGVTGSWAGNVVTISGTPTASGTFSYTVTLTGGCGTATAIGTISITNANTITLTSAAGTTAQGVCINTAIVNTTYTTTGATGVTVTGLPAGVTGVWAANVVTISGTPTVSGTFGYTVTLTGGCGGVLTATGSITVTPNNTITLTSAAGTTAQGVCVNTAITNITYATTGAAGATVTGLPAGVTGTWAGNVVTISGTPTASGTFGYTVTLTGGCASVTAAGSVTVTPGNSIALTSAAGSTAQTLCINAAITNISYATVSATGATFSGLPAGVSGAWSGNVVTISGTPTASGTFGYTITLTGGCGATATATGTITVAPNNTIAITSGAASNVQTRCINNAIATITYATTGATGATFSGLPAGVTGTWAANVATISGTPTVSGTFNYTVTLTGGCAAVTATGTITVSPNNTITLTSAAGSTAQTICINTAITNITYATIGATGATITGLPTGVSGSWSGNVVTISGTPTISGAFGYTVTLTGGCLTATAIGTVTVTPNNTITLTSAAITAAQTTCMNTPIGNITYGFTGASGATVTGLPAGVSSSLAGNVVAISGTPTVSGTFNYTVILTGGCGAVAASGTITVNPLPTISVSPSAAAVICFGSNITLTASGASTYVWSPATGLSAATGASVVASPSATATYNVTGTDGNGCASAASKLVTVNALPNVTVTPAGAMTICEGLGTTLNAFGASTYSWSPATGLSSTTGSSVTAAPASTTTYTVTGTNTNGCVNTATKTITVLPAPDATITPAGNVNICQEDTVYLTAKPGYAGYVWMLYGVPVRTGTDNYPTFTGGFYTLKVTDASGCTSTTSAPSIVTVTQRPVPSITRTGANLDAGPGFTSYQWYVGGVMIAGATGRTYAATAGGSYTVVVTDTTALHCPGKSQPYGFMGVGVSGSNIADAVKLYPNPTTDVLYINASVPVNVIVSSMDGKLLFSGSDIHQINLGEYADGVYRVLITDKNGAYLKIEKITKVAR